MFSCLCVLEAVASGVFEILAGSLITVRVQVYGARGSFSQKLLPDLLSPSGNILQGVPLQILHRQPESEETQPETLRLEQIAKVSTHIITLLLFHAPRKRISLGLSDVTDQICRFITTSIYSVKLEHWNLHL